MNLLTVRKFTVKDYLDCEIDAAFIKSMGEISPIDKS
jgi:hypothetical protein